MRTLITLAIALFCLQLWAQRYNRDSTIIDSLYAIPELDGDILASSSGVPISINTTSFDLFAGDLSNNYANMSLRAFVSFPLPTIPDGYSLTKATMRMYQYSSMGGIDPDDPLGCFPYWNVVGGDTIKCIVSHIDYGLSLDLGDWPKGDEGNPDTYNHNVGEITREGMSENGDSGETGYRFLDIIDCVFHDLDLGNIFSQYRIGWQINSDYDNRTDKVGFVSMEGSTEQNWPKVYYTLYNPSSTSDDVVPELVADANTRPNPFSSYVIINVWLQNKSVVKVKLFDLRGRMVRELDSITYSKGINDISVDTRDLSSGIYLLQVRAGSEMITKKITCLK
jgi:hypothetical protein